MNNLGWKRVRDKSDDTVRLRWCEVKSSINYTAFKEGWLCHFVLLLFAISVMSVKNLVSQGHVIVDSTDVTASPNS